MIVYKITNNINSLLYIGITTKTLEARWKRHLAWAKWRKPYALHTAMNTYGTENFKIEAVAEASSIKELKNLEKQFIKEFNCLAPNGYNLTAGGQGVSGYLFTDSVRKIMSEKAKARPPFSEETRLRISISNTGRTMPRDGVEKARASNTGKTRTPEQKKLIATNRKGKGLLNDSARKYPKEVVSFALELIKQNKKQKEIISLTGLSQSYISNLKTSKRGQTLQGI